LDSALEFGVVLSQRSRHAEHPSEDATYKSAGVYRTDSQWERARRGRHHSLSDEPIAEVSPHSLERLVVVSTRNAVALGTKEVRGHTAILRSTGADDVRAIAGRAHDQTLCRIVITSAVRWHVGPSKGPRVAAHATLTMLVDASPSERLGTVGHETSVAPSEGVLGHFPVDKKPSSFPMMCPGAVVPGWRITSHVQEMEGWYDIADDWDSRSPTQGGDA
jgi:hypothetical protein